MTQKQTPPAEFDRHAAEVAGSLVEIDRNRLPGSTTQYKAILHEAVLNAMLTAVVLHEKAILLHGSTAACIETAPCAKSQTRGVPA